MTSVAAKEASPDLDLTDDPDRLAESIDRDLSPSARSGAASWVFIAKIAISLALIVLLGLSVDSGRILEILTATAPLPFMAAILAFSVQCGIAALRCRAVVGPTWRISIPDHIRFFWIGQFFNQLLPSTIGGDAIRAWLLSRRGPTLPTAIKLTLVDRLTGVIALMLAMIILASLPSASLPLIGEASQALGMIAVVGMGMLALTLVIIQQKTIARLLERARVLKPVLALFDELTNLLCSPSRAAKVFFWRFWCMAARSWRSGLPPRRSASRSGSFNRP